MAETETPLKLLAQDPEDVQVLSAALQDAVTRVGDIHYDAHARTLTVALNRFRWERAAVSELMHFGKWIFLGTVITFVAFQAERLIMPKVPGIGLSGVLWRALEVGGHYAEALAIHSAAAQAATEHGGRAGGVDMGAGGFLQLGGERGGGPAGGKRHGELRQAVA